jgi:hypothetical protein
LVIVALMFLAITVAQQLAPLDPILSEHNNYPQPFFTLHNLHHFAILPPRGGSVTSCTRLIISALGQSCINTIPNNFCASMSSTNAFRYSKIPLLLNNCLQELDQFFYHSGFLDSPSMVTKPNPLLSKTGLCRHCIHLRSLNLHFKLAEALGLKITASRSSSMPWSAYCIS